MVSRDIKPQKHGEHVGMEGENYVVAVNDNEAYALNPAAYYIWTLCDGSRTVGDIIAKVADDLKLNVEDVEPPVETILEALSEAKLISVGEEPQVVRESEDRDQG